MKNGRNRGFWATLPGLLTGAAMLLTAIVGLFVFLASIGNNGQPGPTPTRDTPPSSGPPPTPSAIVTTTDSTPAPSPTEPSPTPTVLHVNIGSRTFTFVPPYTGGGDREYDGHGPDIQVTATLQLHPSYIDVDIYMMALETQSDWTKASGTKQFRIFTAPIGKCVVDSSYNYLRRVEIKYRDTDHAADIFYGATSSFVDRFVVIGDSVGDDAGTRTNVKIETRKIMIGLSTCP